MSRSDYLSKSYLKFGEAESQKDSDFLNYQKAFFQKSDIDTDPTLEDFLKAFNRLKDLKRKESVSDETFKILLSGLFSLYIQNQVTEELDSTIVSFIEEAFSSEMKIKELMAGEINE